MKPPAATADLMREWRRVAGLTRAEAAAQIGLTVNAVRDIEQGLRRVGDALAQAGLRKMIEDAK